jgi:hypothetical protein
MGSIVYGAKYESGRDVKVVASLVRDEIKAAVKSGELPGALKASVRISRYSGGRSIRVDLKVPGLKVYSVARLLADRDEGGNSYGLPWRSEEASAVVKKVEAILDAYNFDGSDPMTDYFHVNFYGSVDLDGDRDAELAALPPKGSEEAKTLRWGPPKAKPVEALLSSVASNVVSLDGWVMAKAVEKAAANGIRPLLDSTVEGCSAAMWHERGEPCSLCAK